MNSNYVFFFFSVFSHVWINWWFPIRLLRSNEINLIHVIFFFLLLFTISWLKNKFVYLIFFRLYLGPNSCYFILKHYCNCIFFLINEIHFEFFFFEIFEIFVSLMNDFFQLYPHWYLLMRYFFFLKKKKKISNFSHCSSHIKIYKRTK